jgi:hypothetical protein
MPKDEFDFDDPMELCGVELPVADDESDREMVRCFAEEFTRMGLSQAELLAVFRNPFYARAHGAWIRLGDPEVTRLVEEPERAFRPRRTE